MAKKIEKERNWFSELLWADDKLIKESVRNYDKTPWYKTLRFGLLGLVLVSFLIAAILFHDWWGFWGSMLFMIPMGYFMMRGYRFSYVFVGLFKLLDVILTVPDWLVAPNGGRVISVLIWTAVWLGLCITCYRIETLRREGKPETKRVTKSDKVFFIVLGLIGAFFAYAYISYQTDPQIQLEEKYGEPFVKTAADVYVATIVIPEICKETWETIAINGDTTYENFRDNYIVLYLNKNEKHAEFIQTNKRLLEEVRDKLGSRLYNETLNYVNQNDAQWTEEADYDFCRLALFSVLEPTQ